ncbi:hypothetical protein HYS95_00905 [Candidatus Daviesbacteria bacterium]|nr:hypothetical protein [Candidatus Daviesbacteria bacterium]
MKQLFAALKIILRKPFYKYVALFTTVVFSLISYWLFYQTTSIQRFLENSTLLYSIIYFAATIIIIFLSGISVSAVVWLFNHSVLSQTKNMTANLGGLVASAFSMGCPVCGAFLLSAIGVAGGLSVFPLQGLELKILSLVLLGGSLFYSLSRVKSALHCKECNDITHKVAKQKGPHTIIVPVKNILVFLLAGLFLGNQILMAQIAAHMGMTSHKGIVASLLGIQTKSSFTIIAPKVNPDGRTTVLYEWPTITEVPANPNSANALTDAKVVMIATGKPFYAPDDVSFDDPINAQNKWGAYEASIKLSGDQETRYQKLISTMMTCSYCCGSADRVTMNKNCGCAHAKAVRGFYRFMIQNYGDKYTDEQMVGESHRWYALWYPKGMLSDYLLATGNESALPHESHGGAGPDGMHGLKR